MKKGLVGAWVWLVAGVVALSGTASAIRPVRLPNQEALRKAAVIIEATVLTLTAERTARVDVQTVLKGTGVAAPTVIEVGPFPEAFHLGIGRKAVWLLGSPSREGVFPVHVFGSYDVRLTSTLLRQLQEDEPLPGPTRAWSLEDLGWTWEPGGKRLIVAAVQPDSHGAKAKLQARDVILKVETAAVQRPRDFLDAVNAFPPGAVIKLLVERQGKRVEAWLALPE